MGLILQLLFLNPNRITTFSHTISSSNPSKQYNLHHSTSKLHRESYNKDKQLSSSSSSSNSSSSSKISSSKISSSKISSSKISLLHHLRNNNNSFKFNSNNYPNFLQILLLLLIASLTNKLNVMEFQLTILCLYILTSSNILLHNLIKYNNPI